MAWRAMDLTLHKLTRDTGGRFIRVRAQQVPLRDGRHPPRCVLPKDKQLHRWRVPGGECDGSHLFHLVKKFPITSRRGNAQKGEQGTELTMVHKGTEVPTLLSQTGKAFWLMKCIEET